MKHALACCCAGLTALMVGCAVAPRVADQTGLFHDAAFAVPTQPVSSADLFSLSPAMQRWMDQRMPRGAVNGHATRYHRELIDALYDGRALRIDYDAAITRNAADTFDIRAGNCLSLVIMTAAFAKALNIDVEYQSIDVDETWGRGEGMVFAIGHVNITLGKKRAALLDGRLEYLPLTVDFFPPEATLGQRSWPINESTVVAMYMNNRAAELIAAGQIDDAYWWARGAIRHDARFAPSYNTLGVVFRRHGMLDAAALAFGRVLVVEPNNTKVMANLATVLDALGKTAEAAQIHARLASLMARGQAAPFVAFNLGVQHMQTGDYRLAREAFARELARDPYNDEVNFWQARALMQLGEIKRAGEHMLTAVEFSTTFRKREIYAAKLDQIQSYRR